MDKWILYNRQILAEAEIPSTFWRNRAFYFADGFFESIRVFRGKILHFDLHFERMQIAARTLALSLPFQSSTLFSLLEQLVEKSALNSAKIRIQIFRNGDGIYNVQTQTTTSIAEIQKLNFETFHFPIKKQLVCFSDDFKAIQSTSSFKSLQTYPFTQAGLYAAQQGADDAILCNQDGHIVETTIANVYWVKNGCINTPALTTGCVNGTFRKVLFSLPLEIKEVTTPIDALLEADEVFITNAVQGIQCIEQINNTKYSLFTVAEQLKKETEKLFVK